MAGMKANPSASRWAVSVLYMIRRLGAGFLLTALFFNLAWAKTVALVMSRTEGPYQEMLAGFSKGFSGDIKILSLEKDGKTKEALLQAVNAARADVVVAVGTDALQALEGLSPAVPLMYSMVYEPLDAFKTRAGGIILKLSLEEQFERIRKYFPARRRIGVVYNPAFSGDVISEARKIAGNYGLSLYTLSVDKTSEIQDALVKMTPDNTDLMWLSADRTMAQPASVQMLIQHAQKVKIPFIGLSAFHAKMGALGAFSVDFYDVGLQTADMIQAGFEKGWKKQALSPRRVVMTLNRETLKQLGLAEIATSPEVVYLQP